MTVLRKLTVAMTRYAACIIALETYSAAAVPTNDNHCPLFGETRKLVLRAGKESWMYCSAFEKLVRLSPAPANDNYERPSPPTGDKTLVLTEKDVLDLLKVTSTEVGTSLKGKPFRDQTRGVVDTLLNRAMTNHWGHSIKDVVDSPMQFSKINGPARLHPYGSVDNVPESAINPKVAAEVESWIKAREEGAPSSVGDNLSYANPYFSDARNAAWIAKLVGPIFGAGRAIHQHGTTKELERYRPGKFAVRALRKGGSY